MITDGFFPESMNVGEIKFLYEKLLSADYQEFLSGSKVLSQACYRLLEEAIGMYREGVPLEYITEKSSFFGLDLFINRQVLIPRPETELLVEEVLARMDSGRSLRVLDIGTGSGNIAVALGLNRNNWLVYACDISYASLSVAKQNAVKYDVTNVFLVNSDLVWGLKANCFDVIVANLPYVKTSYLEGDTSLSLEPGLALDGGQDGMVLIKRVLDNSKELFKGSGWLFLEIGFDQKEKIAEYIHKSGWQLEYIKKDYNGINRIVVCSCLNNG